MSNPKTQTECREAWMKLVSDFVIAIDAIDKATPYTDGEPRWWLDMMEVRREFQKKYGPFTPNVIGESKTEELIRIGFLRDLRCPNCGSRGLSTKGVFGPISHVCSDCGKPCTDEEAERAGTGGRP